MEQLYRYIAAPSEGTPPVDYLQDLVERYPWFTTARLALVRATGREDERLTLRLTARPASFVSESPMPSVNIGDVCSESGVESSLDVDDRDAHEVSLKEQKSCADQQTQRSMLDVIDRFLDQEDVRIRPAEGDRDEEREDVSELSVAEDPDLISEDLAEIYLNQGLNQKAREIYARLSLLYPEKSIYFAELMERIPLGV